MRLTARACALLLVLPALANAQQARHVVQGVVWDSLRNDPLGQAQVTVRGTGRGTMSDAQGRFVIDSVPAGNHVVEVLHPSIDAVGLTGLTARVTAPGEPVTIAIPAFATLWRRACGTPAPPDSGLVYGRVRDAVTQRPVPGAMVSVRWIEIVIGDSNQIGQRRWRADARTDSTGVYGVCGVPDDDGIRILATHERYAPSMVDMLSQRVQRRDVILAPATAGVPTGSVAGRVTNLQGHPQQARVVVDGAPEARTDEEGRFFVGSVPVGTRQVDVLALGKAPAGFVVDVFARDTAYVDAPLTQITVLEAVNVVASVRGRYLAQQFQERRARSVGYIRDSTELRATGTLPGMLQGFPSLRTRYQQGTYVLLLPRPSRGGGGECLANLWIDNSRAEHDELAFLRPWEIGAVEVYPRETTAPLRFSGSGCGSVVIWTKWAFR